MVGQPFVSAFRMRDDRRVCVGATTASSTLKLGVAKLVASALRPVFRRLPDELREKWHHKYITPLIAWRPIDLDFQMGDGTRIRGEMREALVRRLYFDDVWEPGLVQLLERKLMPGDVFVDAGSNFGYMSMIASRCVGPDGKVIAIDASPTIFARLERTIADNGLTNVHCVNMAVSDTEKTLKVYLAAPANYGSTTVIDDPTELTRRAAAFESEIEARPLGQIVAGEDLARTAAIKIDVEGYEKEVLEGVLPSLDRLREDVAIIVELNRYMLNKAGHTGQSVLEPFRARGFRTFHLPEGAAPTTPMDDVDQHYNDWDVVDVLLSRQPIG